jgi:hypothetical protein
MGLSPSRALDEASAVSDLSKQTNCYAAVNFVAAPRRKGEDRDLSRGGASAELTITPTGRATEPRLFTRKRVGFGKMRRVSALHGHDCCRKDLIT